jgi:uncharacterized protein YdaU (DUF1376 family)
MPKLDIWMPFYLADYIADTSHLNPPQDSAYQRLLWHSWRTGKALPDDLEALIQITKMAPRWVDASSIPQACLKQASSMGRASASEAERMLYAWILDLLGQFFKQQKDGSWVQPRLEKERARWAERQRLSSEKARNAARARWEKVNANVPGLQKKTSDAPSIARALPVQSPSSVLLKDLKANTNSRDSLNSGDSLPPDGKNAKPKQKRNPIESMPPPPKPAPSQKPLQAADRGAVGGMGVKGYSRGSYPAKNAISHASEGTKHPPKGSGKHTKHFGFFREAIFASWRSINEQEIKEKLLPNNPSWTEEDRKAVVAWMAGNKQVTLEMFERWLGHRERSLNMNPSAAPATWIAKIMSYADGPKDKFGLPRKPPRL